MCACPADSPGDHAEYAPEAFARLRKIGETVCAENVAYEKTCQEDDCSDQGNQKNFEEADEPRATPGKQGASYHRYVVPARYYQDQENTQCRREQHRGIF